MHALMFWGFCVLFLGTVLATLDYDIAVLLFDAKLLRGPFYLAYELSLDAFGLAVVKPWWGPWSPVGWALGQAFLALGLTEPALRGLHLGTWVFHFLVSFAFIAVIPYSYFIHLVTTPLNIFFAKLRPHAELSPIPNIEEAESLGISRLQELSWKRRVHLSPCANCRGSRAP